MFEMAIFCLLIVPLPYSMKRKVFAFIADNPVVAKLQYGLKVNYKKPGSYTAMRNIDSAPSDYIHLHTHPLH